MVVGPYAGHRDRDFVVAIALERPVIGMRHLLDNVDGVGFAGEVEFNQFHGMLPVVLGASLHAPCEGTLDEQRDFDDRA